MAMLRSFINITDAIAVKDKTAFPLLVVVHSKVYNENTSDKSGNVRQ